MLDPSDDAADAADAADADGDVALLHAAFSAAPDGMLVAGSDGRYRHANRAILDLLGISEEEMLQRNFGDFVAPALRAQTLEFWERLQRGGSIQIRNVVVDARGVERAVEVRGRGHFLPDRHLIVVHEVDGRKPAEPVLSPREREVLSLVAAGLTAEAVGEKLFISAMTVNTHVRNAMEKLGAHSRTHAVVLALRNREITL